MNYDLKAIIIGLLSVIGFSFGAAFFLILAGVGPDDFIIILLVSLLSLTAGGFITGWRTTRQALLNGILLGITIGILFNFYSIITNQLTIGSIVGGFLISPAFTTVGVVVYNLAVSRPEGR